MYAARYRKTFGSILVLIIASILFSACAKRSARPAGRAVEEKPQKEILTPAPSLPPPTPEYSAAKRLVEQGKLEISRGEYEKAIRTLESAINFEPENGEAYYWLAKANHMIGDDKNAMQLLDRSITYLKDEALIKKAEELEKQLHKGF